MAEFSLQRFTDLNAASDTASYIDALQAFDGIRGIQALKAAARNTARIGPGSAILDVGCGFGLETLRLADIVAPNGRAAGLDLSAAFIDEAKRRADAAGLQIDFRTGSAEALPFDPGAFDHVRAERVLVYLDDPAAAVAEMCRVLKPGGILALIEPDFSTTTLNLPDRDAVRRAMAFEADTAVKWSWLPGPLAEVLAAAPLDDVEIDTRVAIFPQDLGAMYFAGVADKAAAGGALSAAEREAWHTALAERANRGTLFGSVGYFLFTATRTAA